MWGITVTPEQPDTHVKWWSERDLSASQMNDFERMLMGEGCQAL
jgi:hypothetical protein